jgi:hypothetical protein
MASEGKFPNLGAVSCAQLTFGADIRLSPSQVGGIRDSVLALFPAQSLPPWYFRELYQWGEVTYEVAASVGASNRLDPTKPYSVFFRITQPGELGFEAPSIGELFRIMEPQDESNAYCSANFGRAVSEGVPQSLLSSDLHRDEEGRHVLEAYTIGMYNKSEERIGTAEVRRIGDEGHYYTISFFQKGIFSADFSVRLLDRAVRLLSQIHRESEGETHAANSA